MPTAEKPAYRFGPFELQSTRPALYRDGEPVAVTPKALATLTALVSRHGSPVGKEELLATIWSGTAVGEANLSQNVYTLRKLLAADFPGQNPIENLPRFGYRFTLPVSEVPPPEAVAPVPADETRTHAQVATARRDGVDGAGTGALAGPSAPFGSRRSVFGGREHGRRRISWQIVGATFVLAAVLAALGYAWWGPEAAPRVYSMMQLTASDSNNPVMAAAPSPDGEQIAYADDDGVMLRGRNGGMPHAVRSPDIYSVSRVAWFPDGLHLAVSGQDPKTHVDMIWSLSVAGDVPALLRTEGTNALPSPDGKHFAFEANRGTEVWVSGLNSQGAKRLLAAQGGRLLSILLWSKKGDELYVSRHDADHAPFHAGKTPTSGEFLAVNAESAKVTSVESGGPFDEACFLPGNELLLTGNLGSGHADLTQLREVAMNPRNGAFRAPPRLVQTLGRSVLALNSAQGGHLIDAVIASGEADVYVADIQPHHEGLRDLRRLTYEISASYPHSWTPDSRSVIFESRHTGPNQLYRQAIDAHNPTQLVSTPWDAAIPIITPDGRWIFFEGGDAPRYSKLYRVSSEGGVASEVGLSRGLGPYRCPLLRGACVISQVMNNRVLYSRLDPIRGEGNPFYTEATTGPDAPAFAVSPDGTELAL